MRKLTITVLTTGVLMLVPAGAASAAGVASPSDTAGSMAPTGSTDLPTTGGDTGTTTTTSSTTSEDGDKTGLWGLLGLLGLAGLIKRRDTDVHTTTTAREDVRR